MAKQPEAVLEDQLVNQLQKLGYGLVLLKDENELVANLKHQLEIHNRQALLKTSNAKFSAAEFERILNILSKGSVFEKAKTLREKQHIVRDNGDNLYFEFINTEHWCQNQFQVSNQITIDGVYKNRYDVTILINGLPLVQIELKRRGLELKEAFNQINRYQKHSFGTGRGLFHFVQLFIISNGVNTKYFSNFGSHPQDFMQTFYWTDENNKRLTNILNGFTDSFLEKCHLSKMICKYIVLNETYKKLMVLRPYQYYAVENIINKVQLCKDVPNDVSKNGYIWHTTGSGKTLTSFKTSQILMQMPHVKKVVFVVDRKDLDYQTGEEFNAFSKGSVDATKDTGDLIKKFNDPTVRLIVTTIQKLNNAIQYSNAIKMKARENDRMVFIFDECHRSQFGDTHQNIITFFKNVQLFGFTGTPILAENANGEKTTTSLFGNCLHKYVITDAIRDENVLKFSIEYIQTFKQKEQIADTKVEDIDQAEVYEAQERLEKIVDYIIDYHPQKTHNKAFTAMFCVQDIDAVIRYYELFKAKEKAGKHQLKIAAIFSYGQNEDEMTFELPQELDAVAEPRSLYESTPKPHRREKLDEYIEHYNQLFNGSFSTKDSQSFYNYYNDIAKKVKNKEVDILLVANMFLTGFDSKPLNTLYVDKNLQYHGLIQAFSRTNRIFGSLKTQGNIVCFRNLKEKTDEAITLFSNKDAIDVIIMKPYKQYLIDFNEAVAKLLTITPTVDSVNDLVTEEDELAFVTAFRELMRLKTKIEHYTEFTWEDLDLEEQTFIDYSGKYGDLKEKVKKETDANKTSILADIDFELELIHRDEINVTYIVQLLIQLQSKIEIKNNDSKKQIEQQIANLLNTEISLRSKRELIEKFIKQNLPNLNDSDEVVSAFEKYWSEEQIKAFNQLVKDENLSLEKTEKLIENYLFSEREPMRDEILDLIEGEKPTILQRKKLGDRILSKIVGFVDTFINGIAG